MRAPTRSIATQTRASTRTITPVAMTASPAVWSWTRMWMEANQCASELGVDARHNAHEVQVNHP